MPTTRPDADPRGNNQVLDKALADTFPASDPPAATSFTSAAPQTDAGETIAAYLVLDQATAEQALADWPACASSRWVSANTPVLQLALSPALALLDALASRTAGAPAMLVHLQFPAADMLRLDNPHECWREPDFRDDVRLFGDRWALEQQSPLLRVPSPLCPCEFNLLVNRLHPDVACLRVTEMFPIDLDLRLPSR